MLMESVFVFLNLLLLVAGGAGIVSGATIGGCGGSRAAPFWLDPFTIAQLFAVLYFVFFGANTQETPISRRSPTRKRKRRSVQSIFQELGPRLVKRAYRMDESSFWDLHRMLCNKMESHLQRHASSKKKRRNGARNDLIHPAARLSMAIRFFAGASTYDIALVHGVSVPAVYESIWRTVDAVNQCPGLSITSPTNHQSQRDIEKGFCQKSSANFDCCVGAIDGVLIWIEKPGPDDIKLTKCGPKNFFCGRKKKFGLNMQAVCDHEGRFLDVSICHPGATSDFLAFATSPLKHKLEQPGFLANDLCLFGDNAYVNSFFMATPYKGVSGGTKDDYNFYHSQVKIKIECAFGMLVHRWGMLRMPIPTTMGLSKITAMVMCLCRLHNYCINQRLQRNRTAAAESALCLMFTKKLE